MKSNFKCLLQFFALIPLMSRPDPAHAQLGEPLPAEAVPIEVDTNGNGLTQIQVDSLNLQKMQILNQALTARETNSLAAAKLAAAQIGIPETFTDPVTGKTSVISGLDNGAPVYVQSHNYQSAQTISTTAVRPGGSLGLNLKGLNRLMGMWELSDPAVSCAEFGPAVTGGAVRVIDKDGASSDQVSTDLIHATGVGGTLSALGLYSPAQGMAPAMTVNAYSNISNQFTVISGIFTDNDSSNDIQVSNHSYGLTLGWNGTITAGGVQYPLWMGNANISATADARFGYYDSNAQSIDQITYTRKTFLPGWSAGNDRLQADPLPTSLQWAYFDGTNYYAVTRSVVPGPPPDGGSTGYDTLGSYSVAKNNLTVASCAKIPAGWTSASGVAYSSFSSAGPTDDGRIKPDITAAGEGLISPGDAAGNYYSFSGTSQAAPSVSGSILLLAEHFSNLYGSTRLPWASTMKGLVIHTADEAGPNSGPDYRGGWGLMNTKTAAVLLTADQASTHYPFFKEAYVPNGQTIAFTVKATGSGTPLKVTICWTDPAATVATLSLNNPAKKLVNDLNLRITKPDNTDALPWVLDPANPANAATAGDNNTDNVEQVYIANPTAGSTYLVKVTARSGTTLVNDVGAAASQPVSIFLSGVEAPANPSAFRATVTQLTATTFSLSWPADIGAVYRVQTSTDLVSWTDVSSDIAPITTTSLFTVSATVGEARRFWRVKRLQ